MATPVGPGWGRVPKGPEVLSRLVPGPETPPHTHPPAPGTGNKAGGTACRGGALGWPDPGGSSLGGSAGLPPLGTCPSSEARSPLQPSTGVAARTPGRFLAGSCGRLPPSSLPSPAEGQHHRCSGPTRPPYPSCSLSQTPPSDACGGSQGHRASPATQATCLLWMMTAASSAGVTPGTTAADLADAAVCRAGPGWARLVGVAGQRAGAQKGLRACPPLPRSRQWWAPRQSDPGAAGSG